jgi:anti-sigma factor RsiW
MSDGDRRDQDDRVLAGLASLRDVEPPPSLVPGVMRRIAEPRPRSFWSWLARPRRFEVRLSPLALAGGAIAASVLLLMVGRAGSRRETPVVVAPPAGLADGAVMVRFSYAKAGARRVAVAGDFNGWDPARTPLEDRGEGSFAGTVRLPPGAHEYMFVVDGEWITDPAASERRPDGFGRDNGVLRL